MVASGLGLAQPMLAGALIERMRASRSLGWHGHSPPCSPGLRRRDPRGPTECVGDPSDPAGRDRLVPAGVGGWRYAGRLRGASFGRSDRAAAVCHLPGRSPGQPARGHHHRQTRTGCAPRTIADSGVTTWPPNDTVPRVVSRSSRPQQRHGRQDRPGIEHGPTQNPYRARDKGQIRQGGGVVLNRFPGAIANDPLTYQVE